MQRCSDGLRLSGAWRGLAGRAAGRAAAPASAAPSDDAFAALRRQVKAGDAAGAAAALAGAKAPFSNRQLRQLLQLLHDRDDMALSVQVADGAAAEANRPFGQPSHAVLTPAAAWNVPAGQFWHAADKEYVPGWQNAGHAGSVQHPDSPSPLHERKLTMPEPL